MSGESDSEPPPKSPQKEDLDLLSLVLHRAVLARRSEIWGDDTAVSSASPEKSTILDSPDSGRGQQQQIPLTCPLRYQTIGRTGTQAVGAGRTINMSSGEILFTTQHALRPGEPVEVSITWPAKLEHRIPLEIVVTAQVVRYHAGKATAEILWYDFQAGADGDRVLYSGRPRMG